HSEGSGSSMLDTPDVPDPVFSTDPATGDVTLTVHGTDGSTTETVIDTAGNSTVTVVDDMGNVTETRNFSHGNTKVTEREAATGNTTITDTYTDPDTGDSVEIESLKDDKGNVSTIQTVTQQD